MNLTNTGTLRAPWKQIRFHHISLFAGLAVAVASAISLGALDHQPADSEGRSQAASRSVPYMGGQPDGIVYYVVESAEAEATLQATLDESDAVVVLESGIPARTARAFRVVATDEDRAALLEEFEWLGQDLVEYSVVYAR